MFRCILLAISLAVAAIPEGLVAVVTVVLSISNQNVKAKFYNSQAYCC